MSLFGTIQNSSNALRVTQLGLQVVSNNIANANTPGYIRQELITAPAQGYKFGDQIIGQGVEAVGVVQKVDEFTLQRIRDVQGQLANSEGIQESNTKLESALNELGSNDISSLLSGFTNSLQDIANQPGNASLRTLAIQRGSDLANGIQKLSQTVSGFASSAQSEVKDVANNINNLSRSIANLNKRIVELEGGRISASDAVGLRDERISKLSELSSLVGIQSIEQTNGSVTVLVGGDYLVADGLSRDVKVASELNAKGDSISEIRLVDTDAPLKTSSGKLKGIYDSRDGVSGDFLVSLDSFAKDIIQTVNAIHSQGQGANPLTEVTGEGVIQKRDQPIELSGSDFQIRSGSFTVQVRDSTSNQVKSYEIQVKQDGSLNDTTPNDLLTQLNAIPGIRGSITDEGKLSIKSTTPSVKFNFSGDTSGTLSALGINTFFSGDSSGNIKVRDALVKDPSLLAISLDGPGTGNRNAVKLAEAFDQAEGRLAGESIRDSYDSLVSTTTQQIKSQQGVSDGLRNFLQTLEAKSQSVSGVSLDEEGVKLLTYQRIFQANSRVISVANELLDTLVNLV